MRVVNIPAMKNTLALASLKPLGYIVEVICEKEKNTSEWELVNWRRRIRQ